LANRLSNVNKIKNESIAENLPEFRQTEQSKEGRDYQLAQINLFKLKGINNEHQMTDKFEDQKRGAFHNQLDAEMEIENEMNEENFEKDSEENKEIIVSWDTEGRKNQN